LPYHRHVVTSNEAYRAVLPNSAAGQRKVIWLGYNKVLTASDIVPDEGAGKKKVLLNECLYNI